MAAKAAQLAQWLKELQDKVNADGNIKYDDILLFTKEKSLTSKQLDSVFKALHEGGVEIIYEEVDEKGKRGMVIFLPIRLG